MDVPHAGADAVVEAGLGELGDDLHLGAGRLDGRHVGIQALDGVDDLAELGVAQVRVDLGVGTHRGGGQAEGSHGPVQVVGVAVDVQGQQLTQGRLVDLDRGDAGGLEVGHLVAQGQANLVGDFAEGQVVAREGPRDDRDGAGEHALDGLVGERLGVAGPAHGHGRGARDVAPQDGGTRAARAVGLHPAVARGREAIEQLGEVLNHVVTLGLAVHEHVESQLLLERDDRGDLLAHACLVVRIGEFAARVGGASLADLGGLRERADGRRGQRGQVEALGLGGLALEVGLAGAIGVSQSGGAAANLGAHNTGRGGALFEDAGGLGDLGVDGFPALIHTAGEGDDLANLLVGEGEPGVQVLVEGRIVPGFQRGVVGHVLEGVGGGDGDAGCAQGLSGLQGVAQLGQVGAPDVAAIDRTDDEGDAGQVGALRQRAAQRVDVEGLDASLGQGARRVGGVAVGGGEQDLGTLGGGGQALVDAGGQLAQLDAGAREVVGGEGRLIELDPRGARGVQGGQRLLVRGHGLVDAGERVEVGGGRVGLGQGQVGDRTDQDGAGHVAPLAGVREAAGDRVIGKTQGRVGADLGNEVVVVGVEPLRHLFGADLVVTAGEREVEVEALAAGEARRDGTQEDRRIQDVVVQGGRVGQGGVGGVQTKLDEARKVLLAQIVGGLDQLGLGNAAGPAGLEGTLELATTADTRIGQDRGGGELRGRSGHVFLLGCATRSACAGNPHPAAGWIVMRLGAGIGGRGLGPQRVRLDSHEGQDVQDGLGAVEGVEVDAGRARLQNGVNESRAEDGAELVARVLVGVVGERGQQVLGDLDAGEVLDAAQTGRVGGRQQAGYDRDGDAGAAGALNEGGVDVGIPEKLRDSEGGTRGLLDEEALDFLRGRGSGGGITRGEGGDGDRQGLEGGAQGLARVSVAAALFDGADQVDELGGTGDTARAGLPVFLSHRRVSTQRQEGAHARVQVVVDGGDDFFGRVTHAGQVRDRLDRGVTHEAADRRAGVRAVLTARAVGDGHEIGAHAQQLINRVPEGFFQGGLARGHDLEGQERGLVVVGAGTGVGVV